MNYIKSLTIYFNLSVMILPFKNYFLNTFNFSPRDSSQRTFQDASAYLMFKNKRTKPKSSPGYFSGAPSLLSPLHKPLKELSTATTLVHYFSLSPQPIPIQLLFTLIHFIDLAMASISSISSWLLKSMNISQSLTQLRLQAPTSLEITSFPGLLWQYVLLTFLLSLQLLFDFFLIYLF